MTQSVTISLSPNAPHKDFAITMRYGKNIGDLIYELSMTHGWQNVEILNIHDKPLPHELTLRGDSKFKVKVKVKIDT